VPPKQSETLTDAELKVMKVLWDKGSGTVQQVLDSLSQKPVLAYNSVLTTIRVLERKGRPCARIRAGGEGGGCFAYRNPSSGWPLFPELP
jgi:predicted transcriptional regulator